MEAPFAELVTGRVETAEDADVEREHVGTESSRGQGQRLDTVHPASRLSLIHRVRARTEVVEREQTVGPSFLTDDDRISTKVRSAKRDRDSAESIFAGIPYPIAIEVEVRTACKRARDEVQHVKTQFSGCRQRVTRTVRCAVIRDRVPQHIVTGKSGVGWRVSKNAAVQFQCTTLVCNSIHARDTELLIRFVRRTGTVVAE